MTFPKTRPALSRRTEHVFVLAVTATALAFSQTATPLSWEQLKARFAAANPNLKAAKDAIAESKAQEITAFLRPNPNLTTTLDQFAVFRGQMNPNIDGDRLYRPLASVFPSISASYLHERQHKRELRRDAARGATAVTESTAEDLERNLLFNLRAAYVQVLQAKAVLENARDNLAYWDRSLDVNRKRYAAGDLALIDLNRLELQRVQFESDLEGATVNLRTSKIQLLNLLNDRTPIEQFDVSGTYDFNPLPPDLEQLRGIASASRPDLRAASQAVLLARVSHSLANANGSADPTFSMDLARNPPIPAYFGVSMTIPLRIFDRNQGEKLRTQIDINRSQRLEESTRSQVFADVDSGYYTVIQTLNLLKPYKSKYLPLALDVRDRMAISYQNGGASLLDYLDAQKAYRDARLAYLNLIGSYLTAAAQLNLAAGREVMQ